MAEQVVIGSLRYDIAANTEKFEKTMVATRAELSQARKAFNQTRTPIEKYQAEVDRLANLQSKGLIDARTHQRAVEKAAAAYKQATVAAKGYGKAQVGVAASTKAVTSAQGLLSAGMARWGPAAAGALSFGAALRGIGQELEEIDRITKTSAKLGVDVNQLQAIRLAGEQIAGLRLEAVDTGMQRFTMRISEAAKGLGEARGVLEELGLDAERLNMIGPTRAFQETADAVARLTSEQDQLRIATKLFDVEGAGLVAVLREGGGVVDEFRSKIDESGMSLDRFAQQNVADAQDAISDLGKSFQGLRREATIAVAPGLENLADTARKAIKFQRDFYGALADPVSAIVGKTRSDTLDEQMREATRPALEAEAFGSGIREAAQDEIDFITGIGGQIASQATEGWDKWTSIAQQAQLKVEAHGVQLRKDADAKMQAEADKRFSEEEKRRQKEAGDLKRHVDSVLLDIKSPFDEFSDALAEINSLLEQGAISTQTFQAAQDKLIADRGQQILKETSDRPELARRGSAEEFQLMSQMRAERQAGQQALAESQQAKTLTPADFTKGVSSLLGALQEVVAANQETTAQVESLEPQVAV